MVHPDSDLICLSERQQQLESRAFADGRKAFRDRLEKATKGGEGATVGAGLTLVREGIDGLGEALAWAIEDEITKAQQSRGAKHILVKTVPQLCPPPVQKEGESKAEYLKRIEPGAVARFKEACDLAAYMTLRAVLSGAMTYGSGERGAILLNVAVALADLLTDQIRYHRLQREAPGLFNYKMESFDTDNYDHRKRSLDATLRTAKVGPAEQPIAVDDVILTEEQQRYLGVKLIDLCIAATGLVEKVDGAKRGRRKNASAESHRLVLAQDTLEWLSERNERLEYLHPIVLPMVEPPLPWGPGQRGGYRYQLRAKFPLVRRAGREWGKALAEREMPVLYEAVNRLQQTAWKINGEVLALFHDILGAGGRIAGVPEVQQDEYVTGGRPAANPAFDRIRKERQQEINKAQKDGREAVLPEKSPELVAYEAALRAWKKQEAARHDKNYARRLAHREMERTRRVADEFAGESRIYFPWNVDFRGRCYPIVGNSNIHPQANDLGKALLTFAEGRPLGRSGARYLAQHLMSCLGETPDGLKVSKMAIAQRVAWVEANGEMIQRAAEEPLAVRWWCRTDKDGKLQVDAPLMLYAACREWARLLAWREAGLPDHDFVSSLPCYTDGSCNGLQHFGGLLACEDTGRAVNLLPTREGGTPSDIYSLVMEQAKAMIVADAADPTQQAPVAREAKRGGKVVVTYDPAPGLLAQRWLSSGLLSRSLFKRPVMTYPYGSKVYGFRDQIIESLEKQGGNGQESKALLAQTKTHFTATKPGDLLPYAAAYLAKVTMAAIKATVVKAAEGMEWLQHAARLVASNGQFVTWTVPATGFQVRQGYAVSTRKRLRTILCGAVYKPTVLVDTNEPRSLKQANAMSPNFIHSLDAAALMLAVQQAAQDGVESFAMVHDSYGAPAGDCEVLARAARQAFVHLYTAHDVIGGLRDELAPQVAEDDREALLAGFPTRGSLDVTGVLASDFFFA